MDRIVRRTLPTPRNTVAARATLVGQTNARVIRLGGTKADRGGACVKDRHPMMCLW